MIFGQKATRQSSSSFVLTDGSQLTADLTFFTIGGQPNTRFLNGLGILDASGAIKVCRYPKDSRSAPQRPSVRMQACLSRCWLHILSSSAGTAALSAWKAARQYVCAALQPGCTTAQVNEKLQVMSRTNTFAIGDATDVKEVISMPGPRS